MSLNQSAQPTATAMNFIHANSHAPTVTHDHQQSFMNRSVLPARQNDEKFVVRFPEGMRDEIAGKAKTCLRSMNAEIVHRMRVTTELEDEITRLKAIIDVLLSGRIPVGQMAAAKEA
ncbi:hypothetical protein M2401_000005 [Pseudomonas sp. JUb42]|uniref:Arc family DNA-binding protein n=1 Tax=Pseudomonas sp. JUb42 TaxID=2940611 RepID=UPI00286DD6E4|nr:Arc family DNA-binding protein [Pseudomonas sp. JUb42]MCS3466295.1 hypothetical protein [Pseudomonas sp. JUb42]